MRKIHFEDNGQDFLWWTLDVEGNVIDCGPFQYSIWVGSHVFWNDKIKPGTYLYFRNKNSSNVLQLKHMVIAIENLENEHI